MFVFMHSFTYLHLMLPSNYLFIYNERKAKVSKFIYNSQSSFTQITPNWLS
jgi:hypothetical protein